MGMLAMMGMLAVMDSTGALSSDPCSILPMPWLIALLPHALPRPPCVTSRIRAHPVVVLALKSSEHCTEAPMVRALHRSIHAQSTAQQTLCCGVTCTQQELQSGSGAPHTTLLACMCTWCDWYLMQLLLRRIHFCNGFFAHDHLHDTPLSLQRNSPTLHP